MKFKQISTSGYLSGDVDTPTPTVIRSILVLPGDAAGAFKIESGAAGVGTDLIPDNNETILTRDGSLAPYAEPFSIPMPSGVHTISQCYITVSNCKLLIGYDG